jgi:hypothetical protein
MRLAVFSPYGALHREGGLLYACANYLAKNGAEVCQLRCDGAISACGRDRRGGVVRSPFQCARCMNEQRALVSWAGGHSRDISGLLAIEDGLKTTEWIQGVPADALERVEFRGVNLWNACAEELRVRWDGVDLEADAAQRVADVRELFASYVRVALASERFIEQWKPDFTMISSVHDPMAHAYLLQAKLAKVEAAVWSFDPENECVVVEALSNPTRYETKLVLEGIASMRNDPRTWGPELTAVLHEVLTYLGYAPDRVV